LGSDLNGEIDSRCENNILGEKYILEVVIIRCPHLFNLFITHGANPFINSHGPLKIAIMYSKTDIMLSLLELGSELDPEFEYKVRKDVIDCIEKFGITNHKLITIQ
jgi:hypothetical protein